MIEFQQVFKHFGTQDVLKNASFRVNSGERVGIVGPNGAGKSTLFELVIGQAFPDKGQVQTPSDVRLGYLRQQLNPHEVKGSVLDYTCQAIPELETLHADIEKVESKIGDLQGEAREKALARLGRMQEQFELLGGYEIESRAAAALSGLGFAAEAQSRGFNEFSGGWQMRAEMARVLIGRPDILLLDEPSNYLDLPAVEWLQRYLRGFAGTLLLISHDRFLLESLTNVTLEVAAGQATRYQGDYAYYIREREGRRHRLEAAKANQDRKREQVEKFVERFRAKNTKASQVQSRIKQLDKMEMIEIPKSTTGFSALRIPDAPHSGHEMIRLEQVGLTYDQKNWVLRHIDLEMNRGDRTALVGFNGMGKTSLLRLMAGARDLNEGKRVLGHKVVVGYQSQEFADTMPLDDTVFNIIRKAAPPECDDGSIRSMLGGFGFSGDAVTKSCKVLSGGEKIRLAFARIFVNPPNLLLLDEPTTHLDIHGREALEGALRVYTGTVCLVSHDIAFVRNVATSIIAMTPPGITRYHGGYDYYREKASPQDTSSPGSSVAVKKSGRKLNKGEKEERRKQLMAIRKQVRDAEQAIESLEAEQTDLVAKMGEEQSTADYETINRRLTEIQESLTQKGQIWESGLERLEELED